MSATHELAELLTQIRLGEDSTIEFKSVEWRGNKVFGPDSESIAQEIAAFANARGGRLVFGVDPKTRAVVGVGEDKLDLLGEWLANIVDNRIDPSPTIFTRRLQLPDATGTMHPVLLLEIPQSLFVHEAPGGYFRRQGETKRKIPPQELQRLFQQRGRAGLIVFDEAHVVGCTPQQLSRELYLPLLGDGLDTEELKLRKLKLVVANEKGQEFASVAGCLMATPDPRDWLHHAYVQCVRYLGEERNAEHQHDAADVIGPLDRQINQATEFVLRNMHVGARKHLGRIDVPQFDVQAVFEAIANAVAHRDYSLPGAPVQVHQFADRLEITSPGALPNSQTLASIPVRTATRNELITNLLARAPVTVEGVGRLRVMEKRGEGVPLIRARSLALSGREPRFELLGENALRVTLYAADPQTSPMVREAESIRYGLPRGGPDQD